MGWEVKIDMSGQSNDCLRVCNVKIKFFLSEWKQGTFPSILAFWGHSIEQFESFLTRYLVTISVTVADTFWPISARSRWGTWVHTWSMYHCMHLG